jgi:excisionase family DNA binding protein
MLKCVSRREAAASLGISTSYLDKLIAKGKIIAMRVGRRRLIDVDELDKLVEEWKRADNAES